MITLDIKMPTLMGCALLWWISRGMTWTRRLAIAGITLAIITVILFVERGIN